jgi:hypothetical protein
MVEPRITIGYSCLGHRVGNLRLPPAQHDIEIIVVVQGSEPPPVPARADLRYVYLSGTGVTRSRNEVLAVARGRLVLFADDDIEVHLDGVRDLAQAFDVDPALSLAMGEAVDENGALRKRYPRRARDLRVWNAAKAGTIEMMVRRQAVLASGVRFDERFGAGATHHLGDEYIFIVDLLRAGLRCRFFPVVVASHPGTSSGSTFGSAIDVAPRAAVFERVFGRWSPLWKLLFLLRRPGRFGSLRSAWQFMAGGGA